MATIETNEDPPFTSRRDPEAPISWIALDSSKPGRKTRNCWVAQASAAWSNKHLEEAKDDIAHQMLDLLCDELAFNQFQVLHKVAHRWRYAAVSKPLGKPFMRNAAGSLYLGGDWCLDARVEAAWASGLAITADILKV